MSRYRLKSSGLGLLLLLVSRLGMFSWSLFNNLLLFVVEVFLSGCYYVLPKTCSLLQTLCRYLESGNIKVEMKVPLVWL
mgnify:CR=1 FL=1